MVAVHTHVRTCVQRPHAAPAAATASIVAPSHSQPPLPPPTLSCPRSPRLALVQVTQALLAARLAEHVERIDTDMALEYQVCGGGGSGPGLHRIGRVDGGLRHWGHATLGGA